MILVRAPLMLAAVLVIIASVLPLGARALWLLDHTSHFRLQYLGAAVVLLLIFAAFRRPRWCVALAVAVVINALPLLDYAPALRAADAAGAPTGRVMTVNLSTLNYNYGRLIELVREHAPDVVLFVEFTPHSERQLLKLDELYPHRLKLPASGAFGLALLSRHPLEDAQEVRLGDTSAVRTRVHAPFGTFSLLGVHLRSPPTRRYTLARNAQLDTLAGLRATIDEPLVIVGDFNITPFSPFFASWLAQTGLRDARADRGWSFSWPASLPIVGIPIDHCVVSQEFRVIDHRRLPPFGSDHYPVLVELALQ